MRDPLHIIVILSDDQGEWAMGCSGNAEIRTPNLDRLAASGMRFTNFFCTSPVCSPARASLLTGRIPSQHGVHDWIRGGNIGSDAIEYLKELRGYTDVLHEGGYDCSISGKWHLGDSRRPQKSFSHWYVHQRGGGSYHGAPMVREGDFVSEAGYITEAITDDALSVLAKRAQETDRRPFYLSVHYTAPHSPWLNEHPLDIVASYDDCPFSSCPQEPPHSWELPSTVPASVRAEPREHLKGYFAAVTAMDRQIGRIPDAVEAYGLRADPPSHTRTGDLRAGNRRFPLISHVVLFPYTLPVTVEPPGGVGGWIPTVYDPPAAENSHAPCPGCSVIVPVNAWLYWPVAGL